MAAHSFILVLVALHSLWQQLISLFRNISKGPCRWGLKLMHALGEMETWHNFLQSMSGRGRGGSSASFLSSSRAAVPEQQNQLVELPVSLCQHQCCPLPLSKVPATHPSQLPHRVYTSADFACEQPWPREVSEVSNSDLPVTPTRSPKSHHSLLASHAV